jgi:hypothetical protein
MQNVTQAVTLTAIRQVVARVKRFRITFLISKEFSPAREG